MFPCPKCHRNFSRKFNLDTHLAKKFDCILKKNIEINNNTNEFPNVPNIPNEIPNIPITENTEKKFIQVQQKSIIPSNLIEFENPNINFPCNYCSKSYSTKGNLNKHHKICKIKQSNENEKENMFKILLEKDKQNKAEINELKEQNKLLMKKLDILIKSNNSNVNSGSKKSCSKINNNTTNTTNTTNSNNTLNTKNINSNNNTSNTQNNIMMVNFGKEDLGIIDRQIFLDRVVKNNRLSGVKIPEEILKIIHFNPEYPQLSNIYISDINREKCMIFEDGEWKLSPIDKIPEVIDKVILFSNNVETDLKTKYPGNKRLNERFDVINKYNNMNNTEYIDELKEEPEYNKDLIKRCENFQKMTYDTFKTTLYNEGKKIKKVSGLAK